MVTPLPNNNRNPSALARDQKITLPAPHQNLSLRIKFCAVLLCILIDAGCNKSSNQSTSPDGRHQGPQTTTITTVNPRRGDIGVSLNALGIVTPCSTVAIRSRVDGQLMAVNFKEGQEVKKGDSLLEIDSAPYQAALTTAEGQLARDVALLDNARLDLNRYQEALARNAIPKQQLDTQIATVHQYEGTVKVDQGQVENARVQLGYCHIAAPVSGRVGLRLVDPGNIITASGTTALLVITQLKPITVVFSIAEDFLPQIQARLKEGTPLIVDAYDRAQLAKLGTGTLLTLDNLIDPGTGTVKLKAIFENQDAALFPNQFVNARLLIDTKRNVVLVPNTAIQRNAQGAFVYRVTAEQTVEIRPITLGATDSIDTEVEGIDPTEVLAADNFSKLSDGAKVTIRGDRGSSHGTQDTGRNRHQKPNPEP